MYQAPLADMRFVLNHVAGLEDVVSTLGKSNSVTPDLVDAILDEAGKFASTVIAPTNAAGDTITAKHNADGSVTTPPGFADAWRAMAQGGWMAIEAREEFGGQDMPMMLSAMVHEIWQSANMAFALSHLLTLGQISALEQSASAEQQARFIPPLVAGRFAGTMNLTESQAGTDLGAIRTRAIKDGDCYRIKGQKIYITYGEHDMAENIIHLVLARTEDAPPGVAGISTFIVPKFLLNDDGSIGAPNDVRCIALEKKLGIKGSPTATLSYGDNEGAIGYLLGEENEGLAVMFRMMNHSRFTVGLQGLAIAERAYQQALAYARERKQGIPLSGVEGDTIIHHPDVLRLLATMKAEIEAMRALVAFGGGALDLAHKDSMKNGEAKNSERAGLLVPIIKGWLTERAVALTSAALQVHGGAGFIEETGVAQHFRDARILPIYEGTTAIQANDLVFRKTLRDDGAAVDALFAEIEAQAQAAKSHDAVVGRAATSLLEALECAKQTVSHLLSVSATPQRPALSGVNYLMMMGYLTGGWMMLRAGIAAADLKDDKDADTDFLAAKLTTVDIYMTHCLPNIMALSRTIMNGDTAVLAMQPDWL